MVSILRNSFCRFRKVLESVEGLMAYIAGLLILFMILGICYEITLRYFFLRPTLWVMGVIEYTLLCVTFLGAGWLLKRDGHVKIDIALIRFSPRGQAILNTITSIVGLVSCLIMGCYGARTTWNLLFRGVITAQLPEIPQFFLVALIPLSFLILSIEFIRRVFNNLTILKALKVERGKGGRVSS